MDSARAHTCPRGIVRAAAQHGGGRARLFPALLLVLCFMALAGCAAQQSPPPHAAPPHTTPADAAPARGTAASGAEAGTTVPHAAPGTPGPALPYAVDFVYAAEPAAPSAPSSGTPRPAASAPPAELMRALRNASLLLKLQDSPPDDVQGLDFRVDKDEAEALRLLRAFGYYDGTVRRSVLPPGSAAAHTSPAAAASPAASPVSAPPPDAARAQAQPAPTGRAAPSARAAQWRVTLSLTPGTRYTLGETALHYALPAAGASGAAGAAGAPSASGSAGSAGARDAAGFAGPLPAPALPSPAEIAALPGTLADAGLAPGAPAEASRILRAVDRVPEMLAQSGYPLAQVLDTRYVVDKDSKQLFASVLVQTGPRARMGRVLAQGHSAVEAAYLEKLRPWEHGALWDQRLVEDYRDILTRQGLFRSIELTPVPAAPRAGGLLPDPGPLPVPPSAGSSPDPASSATAGPAASSTPVYDLAATVADAPQRTVGGGLNYESNRGPGAQAYWEHRNLLGQGERFRAETSLWQDSQFAKASFRKPAFLDRTQEFTAEGWLRNEDTDAYTQRAALLSAGLERRIWGKFIVSGGVSVEGGDLQDPTHPRRGYTMTGLPMQLRYEGASGPNGMSQLDPERGVRASLGVRPIWGYYEGNFTVTPTRMTLSGYWPLGRVAGEDSTQAPPRVVLAGRASAGTLWRGDSQRIPASARYYGGGGGSVRGYAYQSLGPRDVHGDPLGGASFAELSLEARVRITQDIAIVPFLDGGNVYSGVTPGFERDGRATGLQWGAGLGLRYHTAVGPLRLDVATPINPRSDDGPVFLYISIGQSF